MKRYGIDYINKNGDIISCWVTATGKDTAEYKARMIYKNFDRLIRIRKL